MRRPSFEFHWVHPAVERITTGVVEFWARRFADTRRAYTLMAVDGVGPPIEMSTSQFPYCGDDDDQVEMSTAAGFSARIDKHIASGVRIRTSRRRLAASLDDQTARAPARTVVICFHGMRENCTSTHF